MSFCPKCGSEMRDGALFCSRCGERIVSGQSENPQVQQSYRQPGPAAP